MPVYKGFIKFQGKLSQLTVRVFSSATWKY